MNKLIAGLVVLGCMVVYYASGAVVFEPRPLPCEYQIKADSKATIVQTGENAGETLGVFTGQNGYFRMQLKYKLAGKEKRDDDILVRPDIKQQINGTEHIAVFDAHLESVQGTCDSYWLTPKQAEDYVHGSISVFMDNREFDKEQQGYYKEHKYDVYSWEQGEQSLKYYVGIEDGLLYVIDEVFVDSSSKQQINSVAEISYDFDIETLQLYVIDRSISSNCTSDAYTAPKKKRCPEEVVFQPAPLPCAFEISSKMVESVLDSGEVLGEEDDVIRVHGTYIKYERTVKQAIGSEADILMEALIRTDITKGDNDTIFYKLFETDPDYMGDTNNCGEDWISEKDYTDAVDSLLLRFRNSSTFERKESGTFGGKSCDVYIILDKKYSVRAYVDENNFLIGIEEFIYGSSSSSEMTFASPVMSFLASVYNSVVSYVKYLLSFFNDFSSSESSYSPYSENTKIVVTFDYKFYSYLGSFVIDKSASSTCTDEAYNPPTTLICPEPPPPASSSHHSSLASSTKSAWAIAVLGVMITFISLL